MIKSFVASACLLLSASPVLAQSDWSLEGSVGVVNDYRYRGYSLSGEDPALQAGMTLGHASGVYGDVFVSSIEEYGIGEDGEGADIEITSTLGWAGAIGGFDIDAAVSSYAYPDGDDVSYVEAPVQVGQTVGDLTWTVGVAYAPAQTALADEDNRYGWAGLSYAPETWPISLSGAFGYEEGAFAPNGKSDWSVGAAHDLGPVTLALTWVDSDVEAGALVASAFLSF